jgi:DNA/RNA endonuclease YhcR with UshA esterase domain
MASVYSSRISRAAVGESLNVSSSKVIDAADKAAVEAAMPHERTVIGTVDGIKDSDGVTVLTFRGTEQSQFTAVVMKRNLEAVEKTFGEGLKSLDGKQIMIKGKLVDYRGKPQIVVKESDQISVSDASALAASGVSRSQALPTTVVDASNKDSIEAAMPQDVVVTGTIGTIQDIEGVAVINFNGTDESHFYAVVLKPNREAMENVYGEDLKSLVGKHVNVSGKIVEYRDKPEIIVAHPEQITLVEK